MVQSAARELVLGIVGAGVMGCGIAQVAAECGITVLLADAQAGAVRVASDRAAAMIRRKVQKSQLSLSAAEAAISRLRETAAGPLAGYGEFADCDVVVEAVTERMDIKHAVLVALEASVRPDCVIATNTSSLSVTSFASAAQRPERVAGFHFFNPVPLMKVVEVIAGALTGADSMQRLVSLAERFGHRPVVAADTPGFIVNHAGRAYTTEALRIVSEGIATFADIDSVMTEAAGFPLGPFELLDLTGLDVSHVAMQSIYHQYYEEPRYRPVELTARRVAAGLFGRKTGQGFYTYQDGRRVAVPEPQSLQVGVVPATVWIADGNPDFALRVAQIVSSAGVPLESGKCPSTTALIVLTPLGEDATTAAVRLGLDPTRAVAIDCLLDLGRRRTLMPTPVTDPNVLASALALFCADGTSVTVIRDSAGFIAQRILACIVNVGSDIAQQRIAVPTDIDVAVALGLGYPRGPLQLGDDLGADRVLSVLSQMQAFYGDPRYRASPWLKRRALLGVSLLRPD
ncbi:MAG: 3-hydroxyacyl-CoA dehydrogenase [Pseudomonadota bacterium]